MAGPLGNAYPTPEVTEQPNMSSNAGSSGDERDAIAQMDPGELEQISD